MFSYLNPLPSLPEYTGPHKVGSVEYEIPIGDLGTEPIPDGLSIATIRFRAFYPITTDSSIPRGVPWLPEPQTTYLEGYLKMARLSAWVSRLLLSVPLFMRSTMMPAYENAPLAHTDKPLPVLIFSHGLVGSLNTHSAILGELASHGVFCVALEHRDGSGALSLVRNGDPGASGDVPTEVSSVSFRSISLRIKPGILEEWNEQLKIRMFELMSLYRALELLNVEEPLRNLAANTEKDFVIPKASLNLKSSSVTWAGHSFGGTTVVQFLKSIYYAEPRNSEHISGSIMPQTSLLLQQPPSSLRAQITPLSPVVLLDPWFMPLKSDSKRWLLYQPLPCHDAAPTTSRIKATTTVVMSSEFAYHWPECHSYMPAIVSPNPESIRLETQEEYEAEFKKFRNPRDFINRSKKAKAELVASQLRAGRKDAFEKDGDGGYSSPISSFVLHDTTHVTHSDFGLLFQTLTWWMTGQKNPGLAVKNIARCVLEVAGLHVDGELDDSTAQAQMERLS